MRSGRSSSGTVGGEEAAESSETSCIFAAPGITEVAGMTSPDGVPGSRLELGAVGLLGAGFAGLFGLGELGLVLGSGGGFPDARLSSSFN